ncbi:MAG: hypothetical protein FIB05_04945 [Betaproteobacteria bacterium]|nr:hypothetical protein [Betaproteobacteria bacterium]PWB62502.1 MAG: hypothetical protein C3F16_06440 [Betaproteobacteria bacterium]
MIGIVATAVVVLAGLYLVCFAALSLLFPERAGRFLSGFASSASAHYMELLARLAVGAAMVHHAPKTPFPGVFLSFGWVLVVTTACLFAFPWRRHREFARRSVRHAARHPRLLGLASLALGGAILTAVASGA